MVALAAVSAFCVALSILNAAVAFKDGQGEEEHSRSWSLIGWLAGLIEGTFDFLMSGTTASVAVSVLAGAILVLFFKEKRGLVRRVGALFNFFGGPATNVDCGNSLASPVANRSSRRRSGTVSNSPIDSDDSDDTRVTISGVGAAGIGGSIVRMRSLAGSNMQDSDSQVADDEEEMTATDVSPMGTPLQRKGGSRTTAYTSSSAVGAGSGAGHHLSRRQRKNRKQGGVGAAESGKQEQHQGSIHFNSSSKGKRKSGVLSSYAALGTTDEKIYEALEHYVHTSDSLKRLGFPVESELKEGLVCIMPTYSSAGNRYDEPTGEFEDHDTERVLNPHARVFQPRSQPQSPRLGKRGDNSNGGGGQDASAALLRVSASSQALSPNAEEFVPKGLQQSQQQQMGDARSLIKSVSAGHHLGNNRNGKPSNLKASRKCMRCSKTFVIVDGVYLQQEKCLHHWGKLKWVGGKVQTYTCCRRQKRELGCTEAQVHVWKGIDFSEGIVYFDNFVVTKPPKRHHQPNGNSSLTAFPSVYAMDAEMAFTAYGLELIRVTVVGLDGRLVYEAYVRPEHEIVDYNTRYSGLSARELDRLANKTLREVQNDLMGFLSAKSILVGHGLENDLRVLQLVHMKVIDTSVVFMEEGGHKMRHSLKHLAKTWLAKEIQTSDYGHDSREDAVTCMELMLLKIREDFRECGIISR